jgi:glycosidase
MSFGIDGWRLDVPNEVPHQFWIEWRQLVKSINPDAYIVGEIWDDARPWLKGDQFDAVMNYKFREACIDFFVKRKTTPFGFDTALSLLRSKYADQVNSAMQNLLGSHDTERLLTLCENDRNRMKLAWLFQMTYIGPPMVYYGDEIGMTGGKDPGCRRTMAWDEDKQDKELLGYLKGLMRMRRDHSSLRRGAMETLLADSTTGVYAFLRSDGRESCIVILNNSVTVQEVSVPLSARQRAWQVIWPGSREEPNLEKDFLKVTVPAMSGRVYTGG